MCYFVAISEPAQPVHCMKLRNIDANLIPGLAFHPACVTLIALTNLRTETQRSSTRDSFPRDTLPSASAVPHGVGALSPTAAAALANASANFKFAPSIILNICGRVILLQSEQKNGQDRNSFTLVSTKGKKHPYSLR